MILECKSCQKKFLVPDNAIPSSGRLVQCSSCGNKWTQYPLKQTQKIVKTPPLVKKVAIKKKAQKRKSPVPYSKEYMQEKWGTSIEKYAVDKGLSNKVKKVETIKKTKKQQKFRNNRNQKLSKNQGLVFSIILSPIQFYQFFL